MGLISFFTPREIVDSLGFDPEKTKKHQEEETKEKQKVVEEVKDGNLQKKYQGKVATLQEKYLKKVFLEDWRPTRLEAAFELYGSQTHSSLVMISNINYASNQWLKGVGDGVRLGWPRGGKRFIRGLSVYGDKESIQAVRDELLKGNSFVMKAKGVKRKKKAKALLSSPQNEGKREKFQVNVAFSAQDITGKRFQEECSRLGLKPSELVRYLIDEFLRNASQYSVEVKLIKNS